MITSRYGYLIPGDANLRLTLHVLQLSDPNDDPNDSSYSDSDDVEIQETQLPSPPTLPTHHPQQKPKLNLRATNADLSTGLFKFFSTVSRDEHLKLAWKPSTRELKDRDQQEQARCQEKFDVFEKAARKREMAAERKRKQQAREKDAKQVSITFIPIAVLYVSRGLSSETHRRICSS